MMIGCYGVHKLELLACMKGGFLMEKIVIHYEVETAVDEARISAMYCFKSCSANQN